MKKKILALSIVLCLAITAIAGATLAYFTDDEQATNTMVIGNVEINIEENVKVKDEDGNWVYDEFVDDEFTLYPVANATVYKDLNAHYNKIVRTYNTSSSEDAAYIRTIILFEKNDLLDEKFEGDPCECGIPGLHFAYVSEAGSAACTDGKLSRGSKTELLDEVVTINNNEYYVVIFTDAEEQPIPYDDSLHTLNAVWMDKNITQEQVAGWYNDANNDGDYDDEGDDKKVEIIVFSQGIQSYDLTHAEAMEALGEVNQKNLTTWIDGEDAVINDWVNPQE